MYNPPGTSTVTLALVVTLTLTFNPSRDPDLNPSRDPDLNLSLTRDPDLNLRVRVRVRVRVRYRFSTLVHPHHFKVQNTHQFAVPHPSTEGPSAKVHPRRSIREGPSELLDGTSATRKFASVELA